MSVTDLSGELPRREEEEGFSMIEKEPWAAEGYRVVCWDHKWASTFDFGQENVARLRSVNKICQSLKRVRASSSLIQALNEQ